METTTKEPDMSKYTAPTTAQRDAVANATDAAWTEYNATKKALKALRNTDPAAWRTALDTAERTREAAIKAALDTYYTAVRPELQPTERDAWARPTDA
jgi:hypothetical protein